VGQAAVPAGARVRTPRRERGVLPGFPLSLGITLGYLGLIVLIPLAAVFLTAAGMPWDAFREIVTSPRTLAAYRLSFGAAAAAAAVNLAFGLLLAWVLERYRFPGRRFVDGMVDLPFALPTAVAGIALATVYAENGWIGAPLASLGVKVAYTPLGIVVALVFVGLPFVVRTVQPVLHDLRPEMEEAAASLGAGRLTTVYRVILPEVAPAAATGFVLAFARALGEYGSVIFVAGNMPRRTEITPLLIMIQLEQYDYAGATAIAVVFLVASFALLLLANLLGRRRVRAAERAR
jgi:sulfate transport system permease protein